MVNQYIICENCYNVEVSLIRAASEEEAWAIYIEEVRGYVKQCDGTFYREETHDDLEDILGCYNLIMSENGELTERSGVCHATLQDAFDVYHVFPQQDGTYLSYGIIYPNVEKALEKLFPDFCRLEIQAFVPDESDPCQLIFASKGEESYLEDLSPNVICYEHNKQATRYEAIGDTLGAIEEVKKILTLSADHRTQIDACRRMAYLYGFMDQWKASEAYCMRAWEMSIPHDDQPAIAKNLAETFEKQSDFENALRYYQISVDLDLQYVELSDPDIQMRLKHMETIRNRS